MGSTTQNAAIAFLGCSISASLKCVTLPDFMATQMWLRCMTHIWTHGGGSCIELSGELALHQTKEECKRFPTVYTSRMHVFSCAFRFTFSCERQSETQGWQTHKSRSVTNHFAVASINVDTNLHYFAALGSAGKQEWPLLRIFKQLLS